MRQEGDIIYAEEGKVFKRKNSNDIFGNEISLGKSYYIDGVLLETPHDDVADDFEEILDPNPPMEDEFINFEEL